MTILDGKLISQQIQDELRLELNKIEANGGKIPHLTAVLVGNNVVKIIAMEEEIQDLEIGSKVLLASKAFNPILTKID